MVVCPGEPTLKQFSQLIADDLPEHFAVVCEVGVHAPEASSIDGQLDSSVNGDLNKPINRAPTISMQKNLEFPI